MAEVFLSKLAEDELRGLSPGDQQDAARAISFLEDDLFREQNKVNLVLVEDGKEIFALVVGTIWLGFYEDNDDSIMLIHLSVRSRFRPF